MKPTLINGDKYTLIKKDYVTIPPRSPPRSTSIYLPITYAVADVNGAELRGFETHRSRGVQYWQ